MTSAEHIVRTLRSTGASAATFDEKLILANGLLCAPDGCNFPDRFRFVIDWLSGDGRCVTSESPLPLLPAKEGF